MAVGALSSLGLGSQGALNYDIIDKLKAVDMAAMVDPISKKLDDTTEKKTNLSIITSLVAGLKTSASSLSDEGLYLERNSSVTGDSVSVNVSSGVSVQEININVSSLAQRDIHESQGFASRDSVFSSTDKTLELTIDSKTYTIDVASSTTISDLAQKINDQTDGKIEASILDTGGNDPYKLIIKSTETGTQNDITIAGDAASDLSFSQINEATDASFEYNGVNITRSSNEIDDLVVGLTINLNKTGDSTIKITQNKDVIVDELKNFVSAYNDLMSNLNEATKYDTETEIAGIFQGVNEITGVKTAINNILLSADTNGKSLVDYGLVLNESGILEFNQNDFDAKFEEDSEGIKIFFSQNDEDQKGIFTSMNNELKKLITDPNAVLTLYEQNLNNESKSLEEEKTKTIERLDQKYEMMAVKFAAYDEIIGKMNLQFQSLQMQIETAINSK
jgi:flagellar hook-associated protein 2